MQKLYLPSSFTKCNENCGLPDFSTDYRIRHLGNPSRLPENLPKIDPCSTARSLILLVFCRCLLVPFHCSRCHWDYYCSILIIWPAGDVCLFKIVFTVLCIQSTVLLFFSPLHWNIILSIITFLICFVIDRHS